MRTTRRFYSGFEMRRRRRRRILSFFPVLENTQIMNVKTMRLKE